MSIKDYNKIITVTDALTGDIICQFDKTLYSLTTICEMLGDIFLADMDSEHGLLIKYAYKNQSRFL